MKRQHMLVFILFCLAQILGKNSAVAAVQQTEMTAATPISPALILKLKSLSEDYVAVQVWSTFCVPCGEEVKEFNAALANVNRETKKLAVLGVPVQSSKRNIRAFIDHFKPAFDQWEPDPVFVKLASEHRVLPWTLLFGKDRKLIREWNGKITNDELVSELERHDG